MRISIKKMVLYGALFEPKQRRSAIYTESDLNYGEVKSRYRT